MRLITGLAACLALSTSAQADILYAWAQFDSHGQQIARVVVDSATDCPMLTSATGDMATTLRGPAPTGFDEIKVCETTAPYNPGSSAGGHALPDPVHTMVNTVVLGDTGCRVKGRDIQNCNGNAKGDGPEWNYAAIAAQAAKQNVDVILHVGDMHYREYTKCDGDPTCEKAKLGTNHKMIGYTWASWQADFFTPSKPLFAKAPWIVVRGNHEDCTRAWKGWFYLLDPRPLPAGPWPPVCPSLSSTPPNAASAHYLYTKPYGVAFDNVQVIVMDSSFIADDYEPAPDPGTVTQYAAEFSTVETLAANAKTKSWLVTHRPFRALASYTSGGVDKVTITDATLMAALKASAKNALPATVSLVLAGHVHLFEMLIFGTAPPPQLVFGAGGTRLDPALNSPSLRHAADKLLTTLGATDFYTTSLFDFGMIAAGTNDLAATIHGADGATIHSFTLPN